MEYIDDLKNKRGALDNIINEGGFLEGLTQEQIAAASAWQQIGNEESDMLASGGDQMMQNLAMWSQEEGTEDLENYVNSKKAGKRSGESPY